MELVTIGGKHWVTGKEAARRLGMKRMQVWRLARLYGWGTIEIGDISLYSLESVQSYNARSVGHPKDV
jgi:hypothetical protein